MNSLKSTKALVSAAVLGLCLAICSVAYTQPVADASPEATESPSVRLLETGTIAAHDLPEAAEAPKADAEEPASAPEAPKAEQSPADAAEDVYQAVKGGEWMVAFGGLIFLLVWGTRSALLHFEVRWVRGEIGGNVLAFGTAFGLAIATALQAGHTPSFGLMASAAAGAWAAKGKWSHVQAKKAKAAEAES